MSHTEDCAIKALEILVAQNKARGQTIESLGLTQRALRNDYKRLLSAHAALKSKQFMTYQFAECLSFWTHDGHLQTFEGRERFRKEARELLDRLAELQACEATP